jgi:hypothetical protein
MRWGSRNTRKDAKGDERCGLGGPCHIARPDIETRDALLRDPAWHVQKDVQQIVLVLVVVLVLGTLGFRDRKETDVLQLMGRVARG